ncbi:MAG: L-histidine N(alpha)-methyltransferase [Bacteroidia bacterium]|nr:MAG: L-histidine N(alpha)-methyltransferase [Bacteroidia bacterium]
MTKPETQTDSQNHFLLDNHLPEIGLQAMREEVMEGLKDTPRCIPSKYFYDREGSALFEEITRLPEYYLSRTEKAILSTLWNKLAIDAHNLHIIELGSGDCSKIQLLLREIPANALSTVTYHPVDISSNVLKESAGKLTQQFPHLTVHGLVADFMHQIHLLPHAHKRLFCFFGSTIGNFGKSEINALMERLGTLMTNGDYLLLGLDMIKEIDVLEAAYNDKQGVTERFNKNMLKVVNELLGADFHPGLFNHRAFYNEENHRIEMHLDAREDMMVTFGFNNSTIEIKAGENIHTENSHKFDRGHIRNMGEMAGLSVGHVFTDPEEWFSLVLYSKQAVPKKPGGS